MTPTPFRTNTRTHISLLHIERKTYFSVSAYDSLRCHKPVFFKADLQQVCMQTLSQLLCVRLHICTFLPSVTHGAIDHPLLCHISPHIRSEGCSPGQLLFLRLFCNASHFHELFYGSERPLCSLEWCPVQKHREENITKPPMILRTCSLQIRSSVLK